MKKTLICMVLFVGVSSGAQAAVSGLLRVRTLQEDNSTFVDEKDNATFVEDDDDILVNGTAPIVVEPETELTEWAPDALVIPTLQPEPVPHNDLCTNAQNLPLTTRGVDGRPELVLPGSTVGATKQDLEPCNRLRSPTSPLVWYTVVGTGNELTVTTCFPETELDTQVSVYSGSCDEGLVCLAQNDDAINPKCEENSLASRVSFPSEHGVTYYIVVHAIANRVGSFSIAVTGRNDLCSFADGMAVGETLAGDASKSQYNLRDVLAQCGYTEKAYHGEWHKGAWDHQPRGRWYKVVGTGRPLRATTCPGTFYAHRIHVFSGDCNECLGGQDSSRECASYEWDTVAGELYTIVVHRAFPGYDMTVDSELPAQFDNPPGESMPAPFDLTIEEVEDVESHASRSGSTERYDQDIDWFQ